MASPVRIILGVFAGVAFFSSLALLGMRFPDVAPRVCGAIIGFGASAFLLFRARQCLHTGIAGVKYGIYKRAEHPWHFWFYVALMLLVGVVFLSLGACSVWAPSVVT